MSGFLRRLSPRHADALRPAAPLRALASGPAEPAIQAREGLAEASLVDVANHIPAHTADIATSARAASTNDPARTTATAPAHYTPEAPGPSAAATSRPMAQPLQPAPARPDAPGFDAPVNEALERPGFDAHGQATPPAPSTPMVLSRTPEPASRASLPSPIDVRPPLHASPPLSASTVARLDTAATTSAPPTIHLHIDRIEVRAAARPASPAPVRPRAVPEPQSLHDYLHGTRRG
ncbi:hypothetical protein [Luteimonas kalidii]|uniref:Uncharacterized protein n=1 Tax=Luteimonas kalidii TaxID=3042025 RepID=A0ABT6JSK6_9GAMM|nr:hypothetical protein [Luteimonas kalidii]MDH5833679.1 hypothetical protein [Luteimonas kalidii]